MTFFIDKSINYMGKEHYVSFNFVQLSHCSDNYGFSSLWGFRKMCVVESFFLNGGKIQDGRHL